MPKRGPKTKAREKMRKLYSSRPYSQKSRYLDKTREMKRAVKKRYLKRKGPKRTEMDKKQQEKTSRGKRRR